MPPAGGPAWEPVTSPDGLSEWKPHGPEVAAAPARAPCSGPACWPTRAAPSWPAVTQTRSFDGAVFYAADGAVGISHLFSSGLPSNRLWSGIGQAVATLHP